MRTGHRVARTLAASVPLVLLLGGAPVRADPNIIYRVANWYAFTDNDANGAPVCGIATQNQADGSTLALSYRIGGTDLTLNATKPSWAIPDGTAVEASVKIDWHLPWTAQTVGHGATIGWTIGAASIRGFNAQFRAGRRMVVAFPTGNEAPWMVSLIGSTAMSGTMWRCVQDLTYRARMNSPVPGVPSQPFR
jgi:hypothetical protein